VNGLQRPAASPEIRKKSPAILVEDELGFRVDRFSLIFWIEVACGSAANDVKTEKPKWKVKR